MSSALSQLIADALLWIISLVVYGRVVYFASLHGVYRPHSETWNPLPQDGRIMYARALFYFILACIYGVSLVPAALRTIFVSIPTAPETRSSDTIDLWSLQDTLTRIRYLSASFPSLAGSWLFWAGFVYCAGDL
jgi:hypothetical protein